ncbi:Uncharacterised protein [Mycoplasmopsis bovigenitalium]|uniref:Uncharacterized protein n=1 Tax=Mycoplasmopsis bovigenitalium TaxID=2112 RepID=A0A449A9H8_9BACT|nr:hypothetical protein [Mycoplasmopsis bovigenitalium]VEU60874.1 Uncharacterised protein [Mycoplasmopsis bovigenitalium]
MSKTKIILASTLSVVAVGGVTTAAVVVTIKNKEKENKENKKTQSLTKIQNIAKPINNPKTNNQTNSETLSKNDFKKINEVIKNEYDKETQIINEYDQAVAKYWEEQEINKTIKSHYDEEADKINEYDKKVAEYYKDKQLNQDQELKNKWLVVESKWEKDAGIFVWKIKTSIENYSIIKDKKFKFGLELKKESISDDENWFQAYGPNQELGIFKEVSRDNKYVTLEVFSARLFDKYGETGSPAGDWVLFKVYEPNKQSVNLLKQSAQPITVKYEKKPSK